MTLSHELKNSPASVVLKYVFANGFGFPRKDESLTFFRASEKVGQNRWSECDWSIKLKKEMNDLLKSSQNLA